MSSNRYWNKAEKAKLRALLATSMTIEQIAARLDRSVMALKVKASKLGWSRKKYKDAGAKKLVASTPGVTVHRLL